jgi:membrane associated rhomboid family serine protease
MLLYPLSDTQPSYTRPLVTMLLIAVNAVVFLYMLSLDPWSRDAFVGAYGLVPENFAWASVLTSMFLHGGWMHLLGNMWFLWIFGDNVEDILGHGKFLLFYLACGAAAALTQSFLTTDPRVPMVGASGAIAGVMGAYMVKFPHSRIRTLVFVLLIFTLDIPAWVMLIYWFVIQFFSGVGSIAHSNANDGGVAFFAHVGGFVAGMVLVHAMASRPRYSRRRDLYW